MTTNTGPLAGLRILDLSRILAGPVCAQLLGDLGADVLKIEKPGAGDDTRNWGPPFAKDAQGEDTTESAYYLSANRNKRSVAIDLAHPEGQQLIRQLAAQSDIFLENFKVGGLKKYGLDYESLHAEFPNLIYCSITGFGQTGPRASQAGYDLMVQGMGGIMSITGEPEGEPVKVGVAIADVMCGMYAAVSILSAVRHREQGGVGQHIDLSLLDSHAAWLVNVGLNYLTSGEPPKRYGNAHANISPYQVFPTSDGHFILAIGNEGQFRKFCEFAEAPELADDPRFNTNQNRVKNRIALLPLINDLTRKRSKQHWLEGLAALGVPVGPVNSVPEMLDDPQIQHRGMVHEMEHPLAGDPLRLLASPVRMSETPVSYRHSPPTLGQHTEDVLRASLNVTDAQLAEWKAAGVIG
ncbi:MAG: CaiB/BaiF CoA-transferase family protein [SAR324 cluster bacterium]|nr:CaiB/BaiF CoA-transferase family protein [SAR324 cluster bacterium]